MFPAPATLILIPSSIPAGIRILCVANSATRPLPWQFSQRTSMLLPLPEQVGHVCVLTICPKKLSRTDLTAPIPPHVPHWRVLVPPTPPHTEHSLTVCTFTSRSTPEAASLSVTSTSTSVSLPRLGAREPPKNEPPEGPPKRSPKRSRRYPGSRRTGRPHPSYRPPLGGSGGHTCRRRGATPDSRVLRRLR